MSSQSPFSTENQQSHVRGFFLSFFLKSHLNSAHKGPTAAPLVEVKRHPSLCLYLSSPGSLPPLLLTTAHLGPCLSYPLRPSQGSLTSGPEEPERLPRERSLSQDTSVSRLLARS